MKDIVVSDDSVNQFGFRVLTQGIEISSFQRNPVMLWDHARRNDSASTNASKDIILPIGKWSNLRKEGGQLIATPEFDTDDTFAAEIARKYDKGFINAASIAFPMFDQIEISDDPSLKFPGQTGPTVVKSKLREISLTDIGANYNAVKLSYQGQVATLSANSQPNEIEQFFKTKSNTMKKTILALNASGLVELPDNATDDLLESGVKAITGQLKARENEITTLTAQVQRLEKEAKDAKVASLKDKATAMVDAALSAKKIVAEQKDSYVTLASASEEGFQATKKILDTMKAFVSPSAMIAHAGGSADDVATLSAKSKGELKAEWDKRHKDGTLASLKEGDPEAFKILFNAKYNKP